MISFQRKKNRCAGESISTYVAELHHLSEHCDFGTSLKEMLCDRIVCGIEDPKIQRRLLAEPELTFDKAFELAIASESADKNAKDLQLNTKSSTGACPQTTSKAASALLLLWGETQISRLSLQSCRMPQA